MLPLVPQGLLGPEWNYFFAVLIGIGFGFVLEQAGFSSTKKLAGVFYGYDYVVLRVFFTAAVTAMIGMLFFSYFGWIDLSLVYINPLYLKSAIIGGVIMGFGFIIGGYCPGTSMVGASIGKIDGIFFVVGLVIGVFIWAESFPALQGLYVANDLGPVMIYETLGVSRGFFAFALIAMAILAFVVTGEVEKKYKKRAEVTPAVGYGKYGKVIFLTLLLGVILWMLPDEKKNTFTERSASQIQANYINSDNTIKADKVAYLLMKPDENYLFIDVRDTAQYKAFHFPAAINIPLEDLFNPQYKDILSLENQDKNLILYCNKNRKSQTAWMLLNRYGLDNVRTLDGGLSNFFYHLANIEDSCASQNYIDQSEYRFWLEAKDFFKEGGHQIEFNNADVEVKVNIQPVAASGGC